MRERLWTSALILAFALLFPLAGQVWATAPSISSLSPTSGAVGTSVTIAGANFGSPQGSSTVKFNGTTATATSWTTSQIKATVPAGTTTGNVVVTVSNVASNGKSFTVLPTPTITSLSPTVGSIGMSVTVSGTNFGPSKGSSTLKFNGTTATTTSWSRTQITATVPSGATTGNVIVHASGVDTNGINFAVSTVTSIALTPQGLSVPLNSVQLYTATATFSNGSKSSLGVNATWTSSNTFAGTVDGTGVVTAVNPGSNNNSGCCWLHK